MEVLCVLSIVLLFVMLVGHGMWVVLAWLFRTLLAEEPDRPIPSGQAATSPGQTVPAPRPLKLKDELQITIRHVQRLGDMGAIASEQCKEIVAALEAEMAELTPGAAVTRPQPRQHAAVLTAAIASPALTTAPVTSPALAVADDAILAAIVEEAPLTPPSRVPVSAATGMHPLDRPDVLPPPAPPTPPGRALADVLQSFIEESNIRWGEILAAMLIVLCSVGLVISLRNTLDKLPYFPAAMFTLFTLAFHGAGLYTLRRWNLQAVSRVILVITLLLVPLTFCGSVLLQAARPVTDPLFLVVLAAGIGIFTWVLYSASRELVGATAWPLTACVLGCSVSQVMIQRVDLGVLGPAGLNVVASVPLVSFLVAVGSQLVSIRRWRRLSLERVIETLRMLGVALFAFLVPMALILVRSQPRLSAIAWLSPLLSIAACTALAIGLVIQQRTTAQRLAAWRTAGTGILVLAAIVLLLLVGVAWPRPELLLTLGLLNGLLLALMAVAADVPMLLAPAVACGSLAAVIGLNLLTGQFAERSHLALKIIQAALMGRTSLLLGLLAGVSGITSAAISRKRPLSAGNDATGRSPLTLDDVLESPRLVLLASSGVLAVVAIGVALFSGFVLMRDWPQDRSLAAPLLLAYAAALLAAAPLVKRAEAAYGGSLLLWLALVQSLAFNHSVRGWLAAGNWLPEQPILVATLTHGAVMALVSVLAVGRTVLAGVQQFADRQERAIARLLALPLAETAAISLAAVTPFLIWVRHDAFSAAAVMALVVAGGWLLLAASQRWPWAVSGLQAMLALAPMLFIAGSWNAAVRGGAWWLNEGHLAAQLIAAALATLVWSTARRTTREQGVLRPLLSAPWPAVDQVLLGAATLILPIVALAAAQPLVGWELGFGEQARATMSAADGPGTHVRGWIALAVIVTALAVSLWERVSMPAAVGVGVASFAAVWLAARESESSAAVASAARWAAAMYAVCWAAIYVARDRLHTAAKRITVLRWERWPDEARSWFCAQPLIFGGTTILILTILAVQQHASGVALRGPLAGSFFANLGATVLYAGPLAALVAVLMAYAIRDRDAAFALGGAAVWQLTANFAWLMHVDSSLPVAERAILWLQWNSIAAGIYALVWLALAPWMEAEDQQRRFLEFIPLTFGGGTAMALCVWAAEIIFESPASPPVELTLLGSGLSYLAVALTLAAVAWRMTGRTEPRGTGDAAVWLLTGIVALAAASINRFDGRGSWLAYHALEAGWLALGVVACAVLAWHWRAGRTSSLLPHHVSLAVLTGLMVALAIRGNVSDPGQPWWSLAGASAACGVMISLGLVRRSQPYAYAATVLAALPVALFWNAPVTWPWIRFVFQSSLSAVLAAIELGVMSVVAVAGFWLSRENAWQRRASQSFDGRSLDQRRFLPPVHATTAVLVIPFYFLLRLVLASFLEAGPQMAYDIVSAATTLGLGVFLAGLLWDRRAVIALPLAYVWLGGMSCLLIGFGRAWLGPFEARLVALTLAAALQIALTSHLWSYGANLAAWGERMGIADPVGGLVRTEKWLVPINLLLTVLTGVISVVFVLTLGQLPLRVAAAWSPAIAAYGLVCLAQSRRRETLRLAALLVAGLTAVLLAWARIDPLHAADAWLVRVFRLLMVLAALAFIYGLALPRFLLKTGSWNAATRKAGYLAGAAALAALVATLALEASLFTPGKGVAIDDAQVAAIAVVLVALIAGLISLAVLPGRDPLVLSERGRQGYVYAAEVTAALVAAHLYLCRPLWFDGLLRPYWPFVVMALAFAGIGAAELFQRLKLRVLAEPLAATGSLLPLLPVLGWWVAGSHVDYSLLLLVTGLLYLVLSYARKSWAAMLAAAVAGNGALWSLLSEQQVIFLTNPQLWLIPPALSALVAAQLNRRRMPPELVAAIRYAATIVIYLSSTSEIFLRGLAGGLWPPMILLGLAVFGALAGIALRVRAFLTLGTAFTFLALVAMVRHAARSIDEVWPWWAFGIVLAVVMLVVFGLFEKKRAEITLLIARLRQWEA